MLVELLTWTSAFTVAEVEVTATEVVIVFGAGGAQELEHGFWHLADENVSDGAGL